MDGVKQNLNMNSKSKRKTIAAVVVTYDRKKLLTRCLDVLLRQTELLQSIIVVDNASTDGTYELLKAEGYFATPIIEYLQLKENIGGAGGFYEGIKRGYERGFEWVWLMDDDGYPGKKTLEYFYALDGKEKACYCPVVLDIDNENRLAFGFCGFHDNKTVNFKSVNDIVYWKELSKSKFIDGYANFFNGVFINRQIIAEVGLPRKEMFIHGDENEYLLRILGKGFRVVIMLDTFFYHPCPRKVTFKFLGKEMCYCDSPASWKYYYSTRNSLYINKIYGKQLGVKCPLLKNVIAKIILGLLVRKLRKFIFLGLLDQIRGVPYRKVVDLQNDSK